ncbi:MAG: hypothetical protein ACR2HC_10405 [Thermoleophilaceae bacterium]
MGSLVRLCAIVASGAVVLSLALFVVEESGAGSENQVRAIDNQASIQSSSDLDRPNPGAAVERVREQAHSATREKIDDADDVLLSPFTGIAGDSGVWVSRLVPGALALLLYGFGGLMLANFFPGGARETRDWRESRA